MPFASVRPRRLTRGALLVEVLMFGLLPLLAVSQTATRSCSSCDAGEACGICLMLVPANQCPSGRYDQQGNGRDRTHSNGGRAG